MLRVLLSRFELAASRERDEGWGFRGVAFAPRRGGIAVLRPRATPLAPPAARTAVAAA